MGIGFFQFDNLVRNRVPFALACDGIDFSALYSGVELEHLMRYVLPLDAGPDILEIILRLQARRYQAQDPVVCLCLKGDKSKEWANQLESRGFTNCYFVEGGFEVLLKEHHGSKSS
jgi:rhodanese-related sulfurtransferase